MSIQTAARSGCKAGTLSLNFECKHRFIIRLFFWVIQPMPWLHWIKIKAQYFTDHLPLLTRAAARAPQRGGAPSWREAHREAVWLLARGPSHSPGWVGAETGHTDTQAGSHCHCPYCRALPGESREWWRGLRQEERGLHWPLCSQWWGEKYPLTATVAAGPK